MTNESFFNPADLEGKRILITGASSGIGQTTAVYLSRLGAYVIAVGRDGDRLNGTLAALEGNGHRAEQFDLIEADEIPKWLKKITSEMGPLDGLVHSAGVQFTLPVRVTTAEKFEQLMRVNVTAAFALAKGLRQRGVHSKPASIVFLSSVAGQVGQSGNSAYCSSKGALISLAKSLALEFSQESIRVNCIAPGLVRTEMTSEMESRLTVDQFKEIESMHPLGLGRPDDVAAAAAFLLSDMGKWITGSCLLVDGGYTAH